MSAHVCRIFDNLYKQLPDEDGEEKQIAADKLLYEAFCPTNENSYGKCISDCDRIGAGFGYLLVQLFENVESENEHEDQEDKYVYYGLMWASYKLQQLNKNKDKPIGLNEFFNNNIVKGHWYEIIKEHIEPKKSLLNNDINIEYMSDIYYIFKETCKIFSNDSSDLDHLEDFSSYYQSIISCGEKLKKRSNNTDTDTNDNSCNTLYDMLNHVYNDFRKDYFKDKPKSNNIPDLPNFEEIKVTLESDLQENTNETPESQDGEVDNQQNKETVDNVWDIEIKEEICFENLKPELPIFLDGLEVPDIDIGSQIFLDGIEVPDIESEFSHLEVEYPDVQEELFYIDTEFSKLEDDLPFFEVKYSDLENDPPNIVDELYVPENELSYLVMEPKIKDSEIPVLDFELADLNIEQNDSDNQSNSHQTNTLEFDDPFKNP
ncbi:Plasmodium variant antigen protein Cir/Yir/Bir, putative, partial [Plasmodium chabaudi chabaudi]